MKIALGALLLAVTATAACNMTQENAAATAKCTGATTGDDCNSCCKSNGVTGYAFTHIGSDTKCSCREMKR
jgi:hypothetical protein